MTEVLLRLIIDLAMVEVKKLRGNKYCISRPKNAKRPLLLLLIKAFLSFLK
jgi:hypothetical protein